MRSDFSFNTSCPSRCCGSKGSFLPTASSIQCSSTSYYPWYNFAFRSFFSSSFKLKTAVHAHPRVVVIVSISDTSGMTHGHYYIIPIVGVGKERRIKTGSHG